VSDLFSGSPASWIALLIALAVLLAIDLLVVRARDGEMSTRNAAVASLAWVAVSLAFFGALLVAGQNESAGNYLAGYLVEKSLSLDNVFVFLLVFSAFGIADARRHRLLTFGIVAALVMRAAFIFAGVALLTTFGWVAFIFAAILLWTAWRMFRHRHDPGAEGELVDRLREKLPISTGNEARGLTVREGGKRVLTVGGATLAAIAIVDLIFAIDSVPAILAITDDTYIVFAANAFALLGLRPLFFLVGDLVERLYYLRTALAALLAFIGIKMMLGEIVGKIGPEYSLPVVAGILGVGTIASLVRERRLRRSAASP
jgi:tellurite resistance protein TerC